MEDLIIKSSPDIPYCPEIQFLAKSGKCLIQGESYMEDMYKFYKPVLTWLNKYINEVKKHIELNLKLTYFNTSSSRALLDILDILKMYEDQGGKITINWHYDRNDPDMLDEIEDFIIESNMQINKIKADLKT